MNSKSFVSSDLKSEGHTVPSKTHSDLHGPGARAFVYLSGCCFMGFQPVHHLTSHSFDAVPMTNYSFDACKLLVWSKCQMFIVYQTKREFTSIIIIFLMPLGWWDWCCSFCTEVLKVSFIFPFILKDIRTKDRVDRISAVQSGYRQHVCMPDWDIKIISTD